MRWKRTLPGVGGLARGAGLKPGLRIMVKGVQLRAPLRPRAVGRLPNLPGSGWPGLEAVEEAAEVV